ncbi:MAG: GDP-mannose 4,6-dehydratase [bacterium]|nr:GDP-mannose 4,6-dehydratase [bacterium]MDZ4299855.1 GDP-mannose 4,6-dehydratase [Candidatus Sungbacteria bacterium]
MAKHILITGGAGFIGTNSADYFLGKGYEVTIVDDLSRKGSGENALWLKKKWGGRCKIVEHDITDGADAMVGFMERVDAVLHLAAQVAVTHSMADPHHDFKVNAEGTLNVLEAVRRSVRRPAVLYASTNKVYGNLENAAVELTDAGYWYRDLPRGVSESTPVDFHSPYGCSKGAADQYVRDYARIYGLKTVVFRQSCIYGPHQFGVEDQGWIAWFVISTLLHRPLTIYGDGRQVRDVVFIDDVCTLYELAIKNIAKVSGKIYNIGGGAGNTFSLLEAIAVLEKIMQTKIAYSFAAWRPGDQKVYISDLARIKKDLGWEPRIDFEHGAAKLVRWVFDEEKLIRRLMA